MAFQGKGQVRTKPSLNKQPLFNVSTWKRPETDALVLSIKGLSRTKILREKVIHRQMYIEGTVLKDVKRKQLI